MYTKKISTLVKEDKNCETYFRATNSHILTYQLRLKVSSRSERIEAGYNLLYESFHRCTHYKYLMTISRKTSKLLNQFWKFIRI